MALNFPANPVDGQVYGTYTYNATKGVWSSSSIPQAYTVSETVPSNPRNGDVWFNSANAKSYVYYSDDDSSQWVEIGGQEGAPGTPSSLGAIPDVNVSGVTDGNALIYDAASGNWIPGEGGGKFTVSDTAPAEAENGDTWFKSDDGKTYIYYVDADGGQWVEIASNTTGYLDIGQLNDVTIVSPTTGQALTYDGSGWVNATPASTLGSLTDVDAAGVADGQALVYDSANSEWVPGSAAPSGVNVLDSDTIDVDFSDNVPLETRTVTGDVVFTASNYSAGATKKVYLEGDTVQRSLTFPTAWNFITDKPTAIGASKKNVLDLNSFGTSESTTVAIWLGASSFEPMQAIGGSETEISMNGVTYKVHTFTTSASFEVTDLGTIAETDILVVAGGGGSGQDLGGGGGGGGLAFAENYTLGSAKTYNVTIGAGGGGGSGTSPGGNGSQSSFDSIITAIGGGGGSSWSGGAGRAGGSGGGSTAGGGNGGASLQTSGVGYLGYGYPGGNAVGGSSANDYVGSSGGGGAGGAGGNGSTSAFGANSTSFAYGGAGLAFAISGNSIVYATGGPGNSNSGSHYGAAAIGGVGINANGIANTGGGAGGANGSLGFSGGSGIVIIRYPLTDPN